MHRKTRKVFTQWLYHVLRLGSFFLLQILSCFRVEIDGRDNLSEEEDLLIVAPHISYWDPPLIAGAAGRDVAVHFIAGKSLLTNPLFFLPVFILTTTVDREQFGKQDYRKLLHSMNRYRVVCLLPEGTIKGGVEPKQGAVRLVEGTDRLFVPVYINYSRYQFPFSFLFKSIQITFRQPLSYDELEEKAETCRDDSAYYRLLTEALMAETKDSDTTT